MVPNTRGGAGGQNLGHIKYNSYQEYYSVCLYLDNYVSESVHPIPRFSARNSIFRMFYAEILMRSIGTIFMHRAEIKL